MYFLKYTKAFARYLGDQSFPLWKPYWKKPRILESPFIACNEEETYIRDTRDFLAIHEKAAWEVSKGAILVTADVVGLNILKNKYEKHSNTKVSTEDIGITADFVLKNNLFELDSRFYK